MKTVVITGGTRGIGCGLAEEFLKRGHQVVICGRGESTTSGAVTQLQAAYGAENVFGQPCDMGVYQQVQNLWDAAVARFGKIDIWINNAGVTTTRLKTWELPPEEMAAVVNTNLLGVMYASKVVLQGMLKQGFGQLYNMEGLGSDGKMMTPGIIVYGATKSALAYYTRGLIMETKDTPVQVGLLSPGMVVTDLLIGDIGDSEQTRRVFNILADRVETVAPFLVESVLANTEHGARFAWLTTPKILWRFMSARFTNRDVLTDPAA